MLLQSGISIYYRDSKDLIAWVKPLNSDPSDKWETQNLTNVKTKGLSFTNTIKFNYALIDFLSIDYNYLDQESESGDYSTKYSLNYLKHNLIFRFNHNIAKKISFNWNARYQDRNGSFLKYDSTINDYIGEKEFNPYWLFDAKLSWNYKPITLYAEASNIFNKEYDDIGNIKMPGRWFSAGFTVQISY